MTLLYRLFGIPRNLEECVDKLKKKGITEVSIHASIARCDSDPLGSLWDPSYILVASGDNLYFQKKNIPDKPEEKLLNTVEKWKNFITSHGIKVVETKVELRFDEYSL